MNKQFYNFSQQTLKRHNSNYNQVIYKLQSFEKEYKRLGVTESFVFQAQQFAKSCSDKGLMDFSGIIYSFLIKIPNISDSTKENLIIKSIEIAKNQDDTIHELARIVDLKKLYKNSKKFSQKKYIKTLFKEEEILTYIIKNYSICKLKFKTLAKDANNIKTYQFRLGTAKVDIAKAHIQTDKKLAKKMLLEAKEIFTDLDRSAELAFVNELLRELKC
ncbi:hypothetical protein IKB17_04035 [bacterium]|nr:hypothetical protein [bacterium]